MGTLKLSTISKLTKWDYLQQFSSKLVLGTYTVNITQPPIQPSNVGTLPHIYTQPLITIKNPNLSVIRVFLRYRSLKANTALKSPKYGRTLKLVATASFSILFSVNTLSRINCKIRRTFMPRLSKKVEIINLTLLPTHYVE